MVRRRARVGTGPRQVALALALGAMIVGTACSSDGSSDDAGDGEAAGGGGAADAADVPGADVARPTVSGPVAGEPFNAMPADLAERYDYVEEEYVLEGEATSYEPEGEHGEDGRWAVAEAGTAPYRTRIVVRRPEDPDDFDGTVFVEWFNVSGGVDADPDFGLAHPELLRSGSAYVGVSAQAVGVEGGPGAVPIDIPGAEPQALKEWDPERYGELEHPGDPYSYDIYSQAAQALRRPGEVDADVLGGLSAEHVIAMGESQSGARMLTYVNAVHPVAGIYDGFLVHSRGAGGAPLGDDQAILGEGVARVRADLDAPVLQFETETDLFGPLGFHAARQDDTDMVRTWEVAGTAHADRSILDYGAALGQQVGGGAATDLTSECGSINDGPQAEVLRAAVAALRNWVVGGEPAPQATRLEVEGGAVARDEHGIARGGIRTPAVDAPVSVETGEAPADAGVICLLFGQSRPLDAGALADLYSSHQDYVEAVTASAEAAVADGFLLQSEADEIVAAAEEADVPG